jgi:3-methyladenine DNA glycosylase Tag
MNTNTLAASRRNLYSKDLKHRGFSFVGSTVVYAHTCTQSA